MQVQPKLTRFSIMTRKKSLQVEDGSFFSILGPSGCGKTTLLRMIAGFQQLTKGKLLIRGREKSGVPPNRRPVNLDFQNLAMFPMMNVREKYRLCPETSSCAKAGLSITC